MSTGVSGRSWLGAERRPLTALLTTNFLSMVSNQLTGLAVPWFILALTGSVGKMGLTAAATMIPSILMMFVGGTIADRMSAWKLSIFADVISGVTVALVPLLYALGLLNFPLLLVLMVAGALFDTPGYSARSKLMPQLAARGNVQIERVTSIQGALGALSMLFGALLAGVMIGWIGATNVLWFNAAAFALSALSMAVLIPNLHVPREDQPSILADIREGVRFIVSVRLIRVFMIGALMINALLVPLPAVFLPWMAKSVWNDPTALGITISGWGAGTLIGSILSGSLSDRLPRSLIARTALVLLAVPYFILCSIPGVAVTWIAVFVIGVGAGMINPVFLAAVYRLTPSVLLGRAMGVLNAGTMIASPFGILLSTPLLQTMGLATTYLIVGAASTVVSAWLIFSPTANDLNELPAPESESEPVLPLA